MTKTLQFRRGNTATISAITAAEGEILVDTDKDTIVVGDGQLAGGFALARDDKATAAFNIANAAMDATSLGGTVWATANAAFDKANTVAGYTPANAVYAAINSSFNVINAAYSQSNSEVTRLSAAYVVANAAFNAANSEIDTTIWNTANAGYVVANAAFGVANNAYTSTNGAAAFGHSNTTYAAVNSAFGVINAAFGVANNAYTSTNGAAAFGHSNTTYAAVNSAFGVINAAFGHSNTTYAAVNSAFGVINAAFGVANNAYTSTNGAAAFTFANGVSTNTTAAFGRTNTVYTAVNSAFGVINAAYTVANAAFNAANSEIDTTIWNTANAGYTVANAAFNKANTAGGADTVARVTANAAFDKANGATNLANYAINNLVSNTNSNIWTQQQTFKEIVSFVKEVSLEANLKYQLISPDTWVRLDSFDKTWMNSNPNNLFSADPLGLCVTAYSGNLLYPFRTFDGNGGYYYGIMDLSSDNNYGSDGTYNSSFLFDTDVVFGTGNLDQFNITCGKSYPYSDKMLSTYTATGYGYTVRGAGVFISDPLGNGGFWSPQQWIANSSIQTFNIKHAGITKNGYHNYPVGYTQNTNGHYDLFVSNVGNYSFWEKKISTVPPSGAAVNFEKLNASAPITNPYSSYGAGAYVVGNRFTTDVFRSKGLIFKIAGNGDVTWSKEYDNNDSAGPSTQFLCADTNVWGSNLVVGGFSGGYGLFPAGFVGAVNSSDGSIFQKLITPSRQYVTSLCFDGNTNKVYGMAYGNTNVMGDGVTIFALNADFTLAWSLNFDGATCAPIGDIGTSQDNLQIVNGDSLYAQFYYSVNDYNYGIVGDVPIAIRLPLSGLGSSIDKNINLEPTGTYTMRVYSGTFQIGTFDHFDVSDVTLNVSTFDELQGSSTGITYLGDPAAAVPAWPYKTEVLDRSLHSSTVTTYVSPTSGALHFDKGLESDGAMSATAFNTSSDINLKENVQTLANSFETLSHVRPVSFDWKKDGTKSYGVIAQELANTLPELVTTIGNGTLAVNYTALIPFLIGAVLEQQTEIDELKQKIK